jgi:hypothetical protein
MYDGWFYYSDVYCRYTHLGKIYNAVGEKAAENYKPQRFEKLVQKADDNTYIEVCNEVNRQMKAAYKWWKKKSR